MPYRFGILYVATGKPCLDEAGRSASSVRAQMPDVPTAIFTDHPTGASAALFDSIFHLETATHSSYDKIGALPKTPFERTLFLDSDTLLLAPVYELSELLDSFDLAYCHAPMRFEEGDFPGCNEAFPQGNSGVIVYRISERTRSLFAHWDALYRSQLQKRRLEGSNQRMLDQPSFRQAVYASNLRFTILPPEYNLRTPMPYFAGGRARVKILHGRDPELTRAASVVNQTLSPRVGDIRRLLADLNAPDLAVNFPTPLTPMKADGDTGEQEA